MANNRVTSKRYFVGDIQTALGTRDTGLTVADNALLLTSASRLEPSVEMVELDSATPDLPWEQKAIGGVSMGGSLEAHARPPGLLSDPPVAAELPREWDLLLRASGWERVLPSSGKWATWYYTGSHNEALTVEEREILDGGGSNVTIGYDLQCDWSLAWAPKGLLTLTCSPMGRAKNTTAIKEDGSAWGGTITYQGGKPIVCKGALQHLVDLSDDSVYGGGTLGSPSYAVCIQALTLAGNRNMQPLDCAAADGGVKGARGEHAAVTGTMVLEAVDVGTFNPHALMIDQQPLELRYRLPVPSASGVYLWICLYLRITAVSTIEIQAGRGVHTITFEVTAPEDASDGAPAAGTDPGQKFTAGTNAGLPHSDGSNAPIGARVAIQIQDTN